MTTKDTLLAASHYTYPLSNVRAVVSDRKIAICDNDTVKAWTPSIMSANDYYPFHMNMRSFTSGSEYRYGGSGGQEKDNEIYGNGNSYTAEYWQYDARLGRRWNVDPVWVPWESSYATFRNNPLLLNDPNGDCADCDNDSEKEEYNPDDYEGMSTEVVEFEVEGSKNEFNHLEVHDLVTDNIYQVQNERLIDFAEKSEDATFRKNMVTKRFWEYAKWASKDEISVLYNSNSVSERLKSKVFNYRVQSSGEEFSSNPMGAVFMNFVYGGMTMGLGGTISRTAIGSFRYSARFYQLHPRLTNRVIGLKYGQFNAYHRSAAFLRPEIIEYGSFGIKNSNTIYFNYMHRGQPFSIGANPWSGTIFHESAGWFF